jgi:hypothetical protein
MSSTHYRAALAVAVLGVSGLLVGCAAKNDPALGTVGQAASQTQTSTTSNAPMSCAAIEADSYHATRAAHHPASPTSVNPNLYEPNAQNIAAAYHDGANTLRADAQRAPNTTVRDRANALAADYDTYGDDMTAISGIADNDNSQDAATKITKLHQDNRKIDTDANALDDSCGY